MQVTFPSANNYQISRGIFVAAWKVWFKRFHADPSSWREGRIPRCDKDGKLCELLAEGHRFSVDVIARLMVPWPFRNTLQASDEFMRLNPALLRSCSFIQENGESVPGARLTDQALDYWDSLSFVAQDTYLVYAEARVQADIETSSDDPVVIDDAGNCVIGESIYPPVVPKKGDGVEVFVRALVRWIDEEPYQPMYQRQAVGDPVSGWDNRLLKFFWPKPRIGHTAFGFLIDSLHYRAKLLAETIEQDKQWSVEEQFLAVKIANEIFNLFGVPQREVTPQNVRNVVVAALNRDANALAKMNSGWTWLACFVTAHRELEGGSLAGWNSRVAASLVSRLDFLLVEAGHSDTTLFPFIGTVPGYGGTRPRQLSLEWPNGYRSWASQIASSELVRSMCELLNTDTKPDGSLRYRRMPLVSGGRGPWTVFGVCQVLMGDGY